MGALVDLIWNGPVKILKMWPQAIITSSGPIRIIRVEVNPYLRPKYKIVITVNWTILA